MRLINMITEGIDKNEMAWKQKVQAQGSSGGRLSGGDAWADFSQRTGGDVDKP